MQANYICVPENEVHLWTQHTYAGKARDQNVMVCDGCGLSKPRCMHQKQTSAGLTEQMWFTMHLGTRVMYDVPHVYLRPRLKQER